MYSVHEELMGNDHADAAAAAVDDGGCFVYFYRSIEL